MKNFCRVGLRDGYLATMNARVIAPGRSSLVKSCTVSSTTNTVKGDQRQSTTSNHKHNNNNKSNSEHPQATTSTTTQQSNSNNNNSSVSRPREHMIHIYGISRTTFWGGALPAQTYTNTQDINPIKLSVSVERKWKSMRANVYSAPIPRRLP